METARPWLKKYHIGDGEKFFCLMQHNFDRFRDSFPISLAASNNVENAENWIQKKIQGWEQQSMFSFAIIDKNSGKLIGDSIIKNIDWYVPKAEIGYCITSEFEGKGLMQEVLTALHTFAFEQLGIEKLFLKIATLNHRSFKLAERTGYLQEGILKNEYRTADGELIDIYYYGLTKCHYFKWKEKNK
ncbi:MAG: GNAT family N-acetyltransferase [Chitinophagaceae bacterium]